MKSTDFKIDDDQQWKCELPVALGTFSGKQLSVVIDQNSETEVGPQPESLVVLEELLAHLKDILRTAEEGLGEYAEEGYAPHIRNPQIWITADSEEANEWTLVVERDDRPDFGWHLEFKEAELVEIWSED